MTDARTRGDAMRRFAENIIVFLEASDIATERGGYGSRPWDKNYSWADGCVPLGDGIHPDDYILVPDRGETVCWPQWAPHAIVDKHSDWPDGTIQVNAIQPCSSKDARRHGAQVFSPQMGLMRSVIVTPDGKRRGITSPIAYINKSWRYTRRSGAEWTINRIGDPVPDGYNNPNKLAPGENSTVDTKFRVQEGLMLSLRYRWTATLRFDGTVGVRMMVNSPAALGPLFRLRDIPAGFERRRAIRHWVETHWRATGGDDSDILALVRGHLRGGTYFRWSGMTVEITPSAYDLDRLEELREWRLQMKAAGLDRRHRLAMEAGQ